MRAVYLALVVVCEAGLLMSVYGDWTCPEPNGQYPDPANCSCYYTCVSGVAYHQNCPPSLYWNTDANYCDYPQNVYCPLLGTTMSTPRSNTTHIPTNVTTTQSYSNNNGTNIPTPPYVCPVTPINHFGMYPDPQNCHYFIQCDNSHKPFRKVCSGGLYYNPNLLVCDYACHDYKAAFQANRVTSTTGPSSVVSYDSVVINDGLTFNQTTSRFTAPDDGFYWFHLSAGIPGSAALVYSLTGNNTSRSILRSAVLSGANSKALEMSSRDDLLWLAKGQTLHVSSTSALYSDSLAQTTFMGFRIDYLMSPFVGFDVTGSLYTSSATYVQVNSFVVNADAVGGWNSSASSYVVPFGGLYFITWNAWANTTTAQSMTLALYVNGVIVNSNYPTISFGAYNVIKQETLSASALISLKKQDKISVYQAGQGTSSVSLKGFLYTEINGYNSTAWYVATSGSVVVGPVSPLPFANTMINMNGGWKSATNSFTAPVGGLYYVYLNGAHVSVSYQLRLLLNNQAVSSLQQEYGQNGPTHSRATLIRLNVNDQLTVALPANYTLSYKASFSGFRLYP